MGASLVDVCRRSHQRVHGWTANANRRIASRVLLRDFDEIDALVIGDRRFRIYRDAVGGPRTNDSIVEPIASLRSDISWRSGPRPSSHHDILCVQRHLGRFPLLRFYSQFSTARRRQSSSMDGSDLSDRFSVHSLFCQVDRVRGTRSRAGFSRLLCLPPLRFLFHRSLQLLDIDYPAGLSPLSSTRIRFRQRRGPGNL